MTASDEDRWIFVEDSPFLPARGGGERENLGLLEAALDAHMVSLVVLPASGPIDESVYRTLLVDVPLIVAPRNESPLLLADPRRPYVVGSRPAPADLVERARALAPDATGILLSSYKSRLIGHTLAEGLGLPLVLRMHNLEGPYHRALAAGTPGPRGWALGWDARRIDADERALGSQPWITGIADISAADARWRTRHSRRPVAHVPPFAVRLQNVVPERIPSPTPTVLFVGAFDVATNVDAITWLLTEVWPTVHGARPDARAVIVGRRPTAALAAMVTNVPGAELHADVESVDPYLVAAHVAVNPAVSGSGVNIKLVDYLSAGIPVVSTSMATAGLDVVADRDLLIADDPESFARRILALIDDPSSARIMGDTGQSTVRQLLDPERNLERLRQLMRGQSPPS